MDRFVSIAKRCLEPKILISVGSITVFIGLIGNDITSIIFGVWFAGWGLLKVASFKQQNEDLRRSHGQYLQRISNHVDPFAFTPGYIQLGKHLEYGINYPENGVIIDKHKLVGIKLKHAFEHFLIIGKTGSGKSYYAINWLVHQFLYQMPEAKIFFLDCKGSPIFTKNMVSRIAQRHQKKVPYFTMGMGTNGTLYDGFRGTGDAIYNRLAAMLGLALMDERADTGYYAEIHRLALAMACDAPKGKPKELVDVLNRVRNKDKLLDLYNAGDKIKNKIYEDDRNDIGLIDNNDLRGLPLRLARWRKRFGKLMGPGGFDFEDPHPGAVFSFKTSSAKDDIAGDLLAKIANFSDFMGNEARQGLTPEGTWNPAILIIDEFKGIDVEVLLRQCREFNICVILATQDESLLGRDDNEKQRILSSIGTFIVMRSDFPERFVRIAGSKEEQKYTTQYDEQGPTKRGSVQEVEKFIVNPNDIKGLADGQAVVIRSNLVWKIQFPEAPKVTHNPEDILGLERKPEGPKKEPEIVPNPAL